MHPAGVTEECSTQHYWALNIKVLVLSSTLELHLDQLVMIQGVVKSGEELRAQAFFAYLQRGLEALSLGLESADLSIGELNHG